MSLHPTDYPHAVARLTAARKAISTKPFLARGGQVQRCERCRLAKAYCICQWQSCADTQAGFCLLMYDTEPLKPSNTGWLIADVVRDTYAFSWSRTGDMRAAIELLSDPCWQPYVVFPGEYAEPERVTSTLVQCTTYKKPLFVVLDATWTEARKMFRKSPYLANLPVLSLQTTLKSRYQIRRSCNDSHLCTAEVAALCLELVGEHSAASALNQWFELFVRHYTAARGSIKLTCEGGKSDAIE